MSMFLLKGRIEEFERRLQVEFSWQPLFLQHYQMLIILSHQWRGCGNIKLPFVLWPLDGLPIKKVSCVLTLDNLKRCGKLLWMHALCVWQFQSLLITWCSLAKWLNLSGEKCWAGLVSPSSFSNLAEAWDFAIGPARSCFLWRASLPTTSWSIWKERNARCFKGK